MTAGPADLAAYGNGKLPDSVLRSIGGGHRLWSTAASAWLRLIAGAANDGVTIGVTDSYRTYAQQVDLVGRKGLYSEGGLAAAPGTSEHGWGEATDVNVNPAGLAWLRANAAAYGFVEDTPREPWHWGYHGAGSAYPTAGALTPAQLAALKPALIVPAGDGGSDSGFLGSIGGAGLKAGNAAAGVVDALTSPLDFLRSLPGLATKLTVFGVLAASGAAIIVLGAWRTVQPARHALEQRAAQVAPAAAAVA